MTRYSLLWLANAALVVAILGRPAAAQRSWDDNGNDASKEWSVVNNWNPNGSPQGQPITIGDLANAANDTTLVDQSFTIDSLTVSNGADIDTSGNELIVDGLTTIGGAGVNIFVRPRSDGDQDGLDSQGIVVNADATLRGTGEEGSTAGGIIELESGLFEINAGGNAGGHGTIQLIEAVAGQVMENSGRLFVSGRPDPNLGSIPGTLTITHAGLGTGTLDLDGDNEAGVVDVDDGADLFVSTSLTLIIEVPLADGFGSQIDIGSFDTVNITNPWTMNGAGVLNFNGGTSTLAGGTLTVNGATTQVNLNGGTAVFQNNLTFTDGDFRFFAGTVQFDGVTSFPDATDFLVAPGFMAPNADAIVVNSQVDVGDLNVAANEDFAWNRANQTIVNAEGDLNISVENIELGNSDTYHRTLTINSGNVDVRVSDGVWVINGELNINNSAADVPILSGDMIEIGNMDAGSANVNVGGSGVSQISAPIIFKADADLDVADGAILITGSVTFESVNGLANAEYSGTGTWRLAGMNTVSETTTINMTGGTVDLDNSDVTDVVAHNSDVNAPLTINAATLASYGASKTFLGNTTVSNLTIDSDGLSGSLTVNLDDANAEWTVAPVGIVNLTNDNIVATLLAGSDVNLNGTVNVTGNVRTDARVDIGGTVNILTAGSTFRLSGGDQLGDPNTIAGGTINGPGLLLLESGSALYGFGTINTDVDLDGTADLWADDGTLTISPGSAILDVDQLGTADDDGILDVETVAWNTNVANFVVLNGGELTGRAFTNDGVNGIKGYGLVSAPVINNSHIDAIGGTLIVDFSGNLWDGVDRTGQLNAISGDLTVRDHENYSFAGTIRVDAGRTVFADGFDFLFEPGSTLILTNGTYRSLSLGLSLIRAEFGGTIAVDPGGPSTLDIFGGAEFLSSSTTTLNDDLILDAPVTFIRVGAEFTGDGTLINLAQSGLALEDGVTSDDLGVLIENRGNLGLGATPQLEFLDVAAQASAVAFQQTASGSFLVELGGTGPDEFDRLDLSGTASLDGTLSLRLFNGFLPALGDTFDILTAAAGLAGSFDEIVQPGAMPAGLIFEVIYNPALVQLVVMPKLPGDYNDDGTVDSADYVVWRKNEGTNNPLPNDPLGGVIGQEHYDQWRTHFGQSLGSGSAAAGSVSAPSVPEPTSVALLGLVLALLEPWHRRICLAIRALRIRPDSPYSHVLWSSIAAVILAIGIPRMSWAAPPIKLNGPLVAGGEVSNWQFSPDSSRVVYLADQTTDEVFEIFSVSSAGGVATKLNGPLAAGGNVSFGVQFSPDSSRVLYRADQTADDVFEIFSVPSAGGVATKLNGALVAGGDVSSAGLQFSPDSSRVFYLADQDINGVDEIFSVPSAGGEATKLNGALVAGGDVSSAGLQFSPDSSRVLYLADQDTNGIDEIFSVPSAGGVATKLNGPLVAGGNVFSTSLAFSPDSSRVLYLADQTTDNVDEIFIVSSAGGVATKFNGPLVAGGNVLRMLFSPNSSRVIYLADQTTDAVDEIFSVSSTGVVATKLNGPLVAGGDVVTMQFSPDSSRALYVADQATDELFEIFSVPSAGGAATKLNGALVAGGDVFLLGIAFSPDSSRVLYLADQTTDDVHEIFSVPSTGGMATKLNGALVAGGDVSFSGLTFSPDSRRVLYLADQTTDGVNEIFIVPSGGGTAVKVNGALVAGGNVGPTRLSPDGSRVLYVADQDTDGVGELYVRVIEARWNAGSGSWTTNANWNNGFAPDEVMQTTIDSPVTVTLSGTGRQAFSLDVGGGSGASILDLQGSAGLTVHNGLSVDDGGVLRGDGHVAALSISIASGGEVRATVGERLVLSGNVTSGGRIEVIGTAATPAEIEFDSAVTNTAGTGNIVARNAILRFDCGLTNHSAIAISFGTSDVLGDVTNSANGVIAVAGNSGITFYDDVTNSGTLNVAGGSTAVFFGALAGNGNVGGGDVQALGDLSPGFSPGTMTFGGDLALGPTSELRIELGGTQLTDFDRIVTSGDVSLAGELQVTLIGGHSLDIGDVYEILDVGGMQSGQFAGLPNRSLVDTLGGVDLFIDYLGGDGNDVVLFAAVAGLPGDYNQNGIVDAADYVVWRHTFGQTGAGLSADGNVDNQIDSQDYNIWRAHFGQSAGSGSLANAAVREPSNPLLMMLAAVAIRRRGERTPSKVRSTLLRVTYIINRPVFETVSTVAMADQCARR